jgi:hypothetical protein
MHRAVQKAFEAVLVAQKKLADAATDQEAENAEKELKQATDNLITIEARLELLNKIGAANGLPAIQDAQLSEEAIEKFLEILLK